MHVTGVNTCIEKESAEETVPKIGMSFAAVTHLVEGLCLNAQLTLRVENSFVGWTVVDCPNILPITSEEEEQVLDRSGKNCARK